MGVPLTSTCNGTEGLVVPRPTSPVVPSIARAFDGAFGKTRSGRVEPLVVSRRKKLVSLPARSQVCAAKPEEPSCCRRRVGVLPLWACRVTTGVEVPKPTLLPST